MGLEVIYLLGLIVTTVVYIVVSVFMSVRLNILYPPRIHWDTDRHIFNTHIMEYVLNVLMGIFIGLTWFGSVPVLILVGISAGLAKLTTKKGE